MKDDTLGRVATDEQVLEFYLVLFSEEGKVVGEVDTALVSPVGNTHARQADCV